MAISLEKNSINVLEARFQDFLKGIDTKKYESTSDNQREVSIRTIKSFVKERLSEKRLNLDSDIWKIILDIEKLYFEDLVEVKKIYSRLYNLKKGFHSNYYKQIGKEEK